MGSPRAAWTAHELAQALDHTQLAPGATPADIERLCAEARAHGFASVCVNGVHVARCAAWLAGSSVAVGTVLGFPLGACEPRAKAHAARLALELGARELDMVLQLGLLRAGEHALVQRDIEGVVAAAREAGALVKVILETGLLTPAELATGCRLAEAAGADFVKTSTGFGPRGASLEDVRLMSANVGPRVRIKASGGIRTLAFARELLAAGAARLGTSASVALVQEAAGEG